MNPWSSLVGLRQVIWYIDVDLGKCEKMFEDSQNTDCLRFFDQVGHQTTYAFFTKSCQCNGQTKIMNNLSKIVKFVLSKSYFSIKHQGNLSEFFFLWRILGYVLSFKNEIFWQLWFLKHFLFWIHVQFLSALVIILIGLTIRWYI